MPGDASDALAAAGLRDQYQDSSKLVKRQAMFEFVEPRRSSGLEPLETIEWSGREAVLDAGCGNGLWMESVRSLVSSVMGLDLSRGMLAAARTRLGDDVALANGDVVACPFRDASFDVVLCFWTLYHVPDQRSAVAEFARVLRGGGTFLAATNSGEPRGELHDIVGETLARVLGRTVSSWLPTMSFTSENGAELLGTAFAHVERHDRVTAFAVPTPEPILDSTESMRNPMQWTIGPEFNWDDFVAELRPVLERRIRLSGVIRSEGVATTFVCRR